MSDSVNGTKPGKPSDTPQGVSYTTTDEFMQAGWQPVAILMLRPTDGTPWEAHENASVVEADLKCCLSPFGTKLAVTQPAEQLRGLVKAAAEQLTKRLAHELRLYTLAMEMEAADEPTPEGKSS